MKKPSSGYTEDISKEVGVNDLSTDNHFHDIREVYVSEGGHTRLLYASRYGKRYALKCLKKDFLYTPLYREMLKKELEIGVNLDHPNICHTISMEEVEGLGPTIIMDYVDGMSLQQFIDGRRLTKSLSRKIALQLIDALDYMHDKQTYHRDLKPQNIMVTYGSKEVKIIDFGLTDADEFTTLKSPAGTMGYVAPEQLIHGAKADAKADIYSLGRVMLDMAAVTHDRHMKSIGKLCANNDPAKRPGNMQTIRDAISNYRYERFAVVLALLCIIFAVLIILRLLRL